MPLSAHRQTARFWATWGVWVLAAFTIVAVIAGIAVVAQSGSPNPTEAASPQSHAVVVVNSAVIVFREGLEAILIFAAVTASMLGAQRRLRRPVAMGALARLRRDGCHLVRRAGDPRSVLRLQRSTDGDHRADRDRACCWWS